MSRSSLLRFIERDPLFALPVLSRTYPMEIRRKACRWFLKREPMKITPKIPRKRKNAYLLCLEGRACSAWLVRKHLERIDAARWPRLLRWHGYLLLHEIYRERSTPASLLLFADECEQELYNYHWAIVRKRRLDRRREVVDSTSLVKPLAKIVDDWRVKNPRSTWEDAHCGVTQLLGFLEKLMAEERRKEQLEEIDVDSRSETG